MNKELYKVPETEQIHVRIEENIMSVRQTKVDNMDLDTIDGWDEQF